MRGEGNSATFWSTSIYFGGIASLMSLGEKNDYLPLQKLRIPGIYLSDLPRGCGLDVSPTDDMCHPKALACAVVTLSGTACGRGDSRHPTRSRTIRRRFGRVSETQAMSEAGASA